MQLPDVDGVALETLSVQPRVFKVSGLIAPTAVDAMMRLARPLLRVPLARDVQMVGSLRDATAVLDREWHPLAKQVDERIVRALRWPTDVRLDAALRFWRVSPDGLARVVPATVGAESRWATLLYFVNEPDNATAHAHFGAAANVKWCTDAALAASQARVRVAPLRDEALLVYHMVDSSINNPDVGHSPNAVSVDHDVAHALCAHRGTGVRWIIEKPLHLVSSRLVGESASRRTILFVFRAMDDARWRAHAQWSVSQF